MISKGTVNTSRKNTAALAVVMASLIGLLGFFALHQMNEGHKGSLAQTYPSPIH